MLHEYSHDLKIHKKPFGQKKYSVRFRNVFLEFSRKRACEWK